MKETQDNHTHFGSYPVSKVLYCMFEELKEPIKAKKIHSRLSSIYNEYCEGLNIIKEKAIKENRVKLIRVEKQLCFSWKEHCLKKLDLCTSLQEFPKVKSHFICAMTAHFREQVIRYKNK